MNFKEWNLEGIFTSLPKNFKSTGVALGQNINKIFQLGSTELLLLLFHCLYLKYLINSWYLRTLSDSDDLNNG